MTRLASKSIPMQTYVAGVLFMCVQPGLIRSIVFWALCQGPLILETAMSIYVLITDQGWLVWGKGAVGKQQQKDPSVLFKRVAIFSP